MVTPFSKSAAGTVLDARSSFFDSLVQSKFAAATRARSMTVINGFSDWLTQTEYLLEDVHESVEAYLCQRTDINENTRKGYGFCLNSFLRYLEEMRIIPKPIRVEVFHELHKGFGEWLYETRGLVEGSVELRLNYLRRFLLWCTTQKVGSMDLLKWKHIEAFFIEAQGLGFGRSFKRSLRTSIRQFLLFCFENGYCVRDLSGAIPCLRSYRLSHVPRAIAEADALSLLEGIDRSSPAGIRDYAIIRLLYDYGVRGAQIRLLRLTDINWHEGTIFFSGVKRGKDSCLPLRAAAGNAILAYLQIRESLPNPELFLTLRAPYLPLKSSSLSEVARRHLKKLGINSSMSGAHGFRHAFAKRLLKQGTPFKHIADLLGHRSLQTTFIYTKVDFSALADVALELPEGVL